MNTTQHTIETLKIAGMIVMLATLLFAIAAWAQTSEPEGPTDAEISDMLTRTAPALEAGGFPEAEISEMLQRWTPAAGPAVSLKADGSAEPEAMGGSAEQEAPDPSVTGSEDPARSARQKRKALLRARRQERREFARQIRMKKQEAAQNQAVASVASRPAAPLTGITVSFKLDPRITSGMYMGERWVPTSSGVHEGYFTAEARVQGRDAKGQSVNISPEWIPEDPAMVTVSPDQGKQVTITVKRAGQSTLRVTSEGVSKGLVIKATYPNNTHIQAEISQKP